MDQTTAEQVPPRRGVVETIKGFASRVLGATRDKVEEVSAEVTHQTLRIVWMVIWSVVGAVSLWLALCFAMLALIFGFGLPPRYAFGIPALVFLLVGAVAALMFKRARSSRRHNSPGPR